MKPKDKPVRLCKVCEKKLPLIKGNYCDSCRVTLEQGGKPPIYVCHECGVLNGEEKKQGGLKEGESTQ